MNPAARLWRHLWLDADDARRALGEGGLARLEQRIRDSERRHRGEIFLCVEAALPLAQAWRVVARRAPVDAVVHERALALFGELRVWDTELNNGALIYLQLAEHRIEIVADRGLASRIEAGRWQRIVDDAGEDFRAGRYESGLLRAIDAVGAELERGFPLAGEAGAAEPNELPDRPLVR